MSYFDAALADAPWGLWRGRSTTDSGSNAAPFLYGSGAVTGKTALLGGGGSAVAGSGADPIAMLPSVPASLVGGTITVEAWVNIPAGDVNGPIIDLGTESNGWAVGVGGTTFDNTGKQLILITNGIAWHASGYVFTTGVHHVMAARDSGNSVACYVDGALVATVILSTPLTATTITAVGGSVARALSSTVDVDNVALFAATLSSDRAIAHYNGGAGDNTAVAADSPVIWLKFDDVVVGAGFEDASANGHGLTPAGSGYTLNAPGPADDVPAIGWPATTASASSTAVVAQPTTVTYETWLYLPANPAAITPVMTFGGSGSSGQTSGMSVDTDGKIICVLYPAGNMVSPSALTLGVWHHVVCSVGAAGAKIRIDKATVATAATTAVASATSGRFYLRQGGPNVSAGQGAMSTADPAVWYNVQLSDAQTDAHYDALGGGGGGLTVLLLGRPVVTATPHPLTVVHGHHTDTSNAHNGRRRTGYSRVSITVPIAPVPADVSPGHREDVAIAYTAPTLVNGRRT